MSKKINWPSDWKEAAGEQTIATREEKELPIKLYSSWFCPFAQRAWIAMEEKGVKYQWVEINPYEVDPKQPGGYTKKALLLSEKKKKFPGFVETSPTGLVPGLDNQGERVHDSLIVVEYIDEAFEGPALLPSSALLRAQQRKWSNYVTEAIQKHFYTMVIAQERDTQEEFRGKFYDACRHFVQHMAPASEGPFFLGREFSMVDIALAPFWQRFIWIGGFYRGLEFPNDDAFSRMKTWWEAVSKRPSVANTLVCKPRLISSYKQYARNEATSNYGKMIQQNIAKHKASKAKPVGKGGWSTAVLTASCVVSGTIGYILGRSK
mmetsp:Transcript_17842/g.33798  ORF Transcript_17842/g.33798 Transcript_17842/m.33798 type:complete len:320 (-) Transcript_17842:166-1125(-)